MGTLSTLSIDVNVDSIPISISLWSQHGLDRVRKSEKPEEPESGGQERAWKNNIQRLSINSMKY